MRLLIIIAAISVLAFARDTAGSIPRSGVIEDHVDVIELNHFYDEHGGLIFDQLVFWEWSPQHKRFQIVAWRLLKLRAPRPELNRTTRQYEVAWLDGGIMRRVVAPSTRETFTQYDPELMDRERLKKDERRGLTKPPVLPN